jgi:ABC-type antimicrobial peptide transport system permease subunit
VKTAIARVNPKINVDIRTLSSLLTSSISRERLMARLSGMFGALALALAMLGLYGIMSYAVTRRRKEIGVRVAIGANRARIIRMVLGDVTRVVIVGCAIGFVVAAASGKLVASLLYDMRPDEPLVLWGSVASLIVVALLAGLIPALNASRVDPIATLREE